MAAPSRAPVSIPAFAAAHLALLTDELAAETALTSTQLATAAPAALGRAGLAATNLVLGARRTGLGGKTVLELEPDPALGGGGPRSANGATEDEPQHNLRVGDVVRVAPQPKGRERKREARALEARGADAVVTRVGRGAARGGLEVALDREDEDDGKQADALAGRVWVVKLANEATFKRMRWTLERLRTMAEREYTPLVRVLFGLDAPAPLPPDLEDPDRGPGKVEFLDPSLDDSQRDAVRFALAAREVALIHGPPGVTSPPFLSPLLSPSVRRRALNRDGRRPARRTRSSSSSASWCGAASACSRAGRPTRPSTTSSSGWRRAACPWCASATRPACCPPCSTTRSTC